MTPIYLRTTAGKVHRGVIDDVGNVLTSEGCNLDDSRNEEVLSTYPEATEYADQCRNCFPAAIDTDEPVAEDAGV